MDQSLITKELLAWMVNFVEQPHANLNNWTVCPYAKQARLSNNISIRQGISPYDDCLDLLSYDWSQEVVVFWYNQFDSTNFIDEVRRANEVLLEKNIVALEDHPEITETVNEIKMNFGVCPIIICQQLDKLTIASEKLKSKGYYDTWSQEEVDNIVTWRHH
jgi:hypothetical protein